MAETLTIYRTGLFWHPTRAGGHKCGNDPLKHDYAYKVSCRVSGDLRPPKHFVCDNNDIHDLVVRLFPRKMSEGMSCERMASKLNISLRSLLALNGFSPLMVRVVITGDLTWSSSALECLWEADSVAGTRLAGFPLKNPAR